MTIIIEKRGFTLTEVVISVAILSVVSIPLIGLLNAIVVKSSPEDQMLCCLVAQGAMENTLLTKSFDDVSFEITQDNKSFICERKVTRAGDLMKISLVVRRTTGDKKIRLVRYLYDTDYQEK